MAAAVAACNDALHSRLDNVQEARGPPCGICLYAYDKLSTPSGHECCLVDVEPLLWLPTFKLEIIFICMQGQVSGGPNKSSANGPLASAPVAPQAATGPSSKATATEGWDQPGVIPTTSGKDEWGDLEPSSSSSSQREPVRGGQGPGRGARGQQQGGRGGAGRGRGRNRYDAVSGIIAVSSVQV